MRWRAGQYLILFCPWLSVQFKKILQASMFPALDFFIFFLRHISGPIKGNWRNCMKMFLAIYKYSGPLIWKNFIWGVKRRWSTIVFSVAEIVFLTLPWSEVLYRKQLWVTDKVEAGEERGLKHPAGLPQLSRCHIYCLPSPPPSSTVLIVSSEPCLLEAI